MKKGIVGVPGVPSELLAPSTSQPNDRAAKPRRRKPSTAAEVRRLLALADKLINTAHALQKEAAAKLRNG